MVRKIFLVIFSLISFLIIIGVLTSNTNGDGGMVFYIFPPILFIIGLFRIFFCLGTDLHILYRLKDIICGVILAFPVFLSNWYDSTKSIVPIIALFVMLGCSAIPVIKKINAEE